MANAQRELRIGILIDSYEIPAWLYGALEQATCSGTVRITTLVRNAGKPPSNRSLMSFKRWLFSAFTRFDRAITQRVVKDRCAMLKRDIRELAPEAKTIDVVPLHSKYCDRVSEVDIEKIRSEGLDVLVRSGFRILTGAVLAAAKCGVWSYHHGDNRLNRGGPPCFWEFVECWDYAGAVLQRISEDLDGGTVLARVSVRANGMQCTWGLLKQDLYWKSASALPSCLRFLASHENRAKAMRELAQSHERTFDVYDRRLYRAPGYWPVFRAFVVLIARLICRSYMNIWRKAGRFPKPDWSILCCARDGSSEGSSVRLEMRKFKKLIPPRGFFWADPFAVKHDGKRFLFFEEFDYSRQKGYIAAAELQGTSIVGKATKVLEEPGHISYPFLFRYDGALYMCPESRQSGEIRVYKCIEFPFRWRYERTLMSGVSAADTTLLEHNGAWWLFTCMRSVPDTSDKSELHIFYASSPLSSDWQPHARNPVSMSAEDARPGGRFVLLEGKVYRISQDGRSYGYGIVINEVLELNEVSYRERRVERIEPLWGEEVSAIHTLNIYEDLILADCRLRG